MNNMRRLDDQSEKSPDSIKILKVAPRHSENGFESTIMNDCGGESRTPLAGDASVNDH